MGSPSSYRRKRPVIFLDCSAFIEKLSRSKGAGARARANHATKCYAERMRNAIEGNHLNCILSKSRAERSFPVLQLFADSK